MPTEDLYRRSRQIGEVLAKARKRAGKSLREVAEQIGTSRQRYALIESGQTYIAAVELEVISRFLSIDPVEVLPRDFLEHVFGSMQEVTLLATRGDKVRLQVRVILETEE